MIKEDQEAKRLRSVYESYVAAGLGESKWSLTKPGNAASQREKMRTLTRMLDDARLLPLANKRILEVGCGEGRTLRALVELGATPSLLAGIDLGADRIETAKSILPAADLHAGDARSLPFPSESFHIVIIFTVFSSILEQECAAQVAAEAKRVLKLGGAVALYDFRYSNPRNPNVRGVKRADLQRWFAELSGAWRTLTLLPPLARRLGAMTDSAYPALAAIPLLRTHLLGVLIKPAIRPNFEPITTSRFEAVLDWAISKHSIRIKFVSDAKGTILQAMAR